MASYIYDDCVVRMYVLAVVVRHQLVVDNSVAAAAVCTDGGRVSVSGGPAFTVTPAVDGAGCMYVCIFITQM